MLTAQSSTAVNTTTTLVASPLATTGGSSVQFTATVAPSPGALGTVNFLDNGVAITGGLEAGEKVVVLSSMPLKDGQAVKVAEGKPNEKREGAKP